LQLYDFVTFEASSKITSAVPEITVTSVGVFCTNRLILNCTINMTTGLPEPPIAPAGLSNGQITEGVYLCERVKREEVRR